MNPAPGAIVIMGVSGSGKTTLGMRLAKRLHTPFIEGDELHPTANVEKMRAGIPLSDADRWPWLDALACAYAAATVSQPLAVGSCSALRRAYRDRLREGIPVPVRFIFLELGRADLERRLLHRPGHYMPVALLDSQLAALERPGVDEGALALDGTRPVEELLAAIVAWIAVPAGG
jgi:gluconokinase